MREPEVLAGLPACDGALAGDVGGPAAVDLAGVGAEAPPRPARRPRALIPPSRMARLTRLLGPRGTRSSRRARRSFLVVGGFYLRLALLLLRLLLPFALLLRRVLRTLRGFLAVIGLTVHVPTCLS